MRRRTAIAFTTPAASVAAPDGQKSCPSKGRAKDYTKAHAKKDNHIGARLASSCSRSTC